jgi:hypothetical protein
VHLWARSHVHFLKFPQQVPIHKCSQVIKYILTLKRTLQKIIHITSMSVQGELCRKKCLVLGQTTRQIPDVQSKYRTTELTVTKEQIEFVQLRKDRELQWAGRDRGDRDQRGRDDRRPDRRTCALLPESLHFCSLPSAHPAASLSHPSLLSLSRLLALSLSLLSLSLSLPRVRAQWIEIRVLVGSIWD